MPPDSSFDPEAFLDGAISGSSSTTPLQCPEGTYRGQAAEADRFRLREVNTKNGLRRILELPWEVLDDTVRAQLERPNVYVNQSLWLDFDESGALDMGKGKNVDLGRVREALSKNDPTVPFKIRDLASGQATISVAHRQNERGEPQAEVRRVAPLA